MARQETIYQPFPSKNKKHKYSVYVKGSNGKPKLIGFGAPGFGDWRSRTATTKQRDAYQARARAIKKGDGSLAYKDKDTPAWWSYYYLWGGT
jgi:hypothetical protein